MKQSLPMKILQDQTDPAGFLNDPGKGNPTMEIPIRESPQRKKNSKNPEESHSESCCKGLETWQRWKDCRAECGWDSFGRNVPSEWIPAKDRIQTEVDSLLRILIHQQLTW